MSNNFIFADQATSNLATAITPISTQITVTTGTGQLFPNPGAGQQFALVLVPAAGGTNYEIVYVTGVTGNTFTVLRGQEGTVAGTWNVGDVCFNGVTNGTLGNFGQLSAANTWQQQQTLAGGLVATGGLIDALTPNIGTTGGLRLRGYAGASPLAFLQVTDPTGKTEWGNFQFQPNTGGADSGPAQWNGGPFSFPNGVLANASSASTLLTTRNIAMTGPVSWNVNFNGSGNVSGSSSIGSGVINGGNIAGGTITGGNIAGNTITGGNVAQATLTGWHLAGGSVTASNLAGGTAVANIGYTPANQASLGGLAWQNNIGSYIGFGGNQANGAVWFPANNGANMIINWGSTYVGANAEVQVYFTQSYSYGCVSVCCPGYANNTTVANIAQYNNSFVIHNGSGTGMTVWWITIGQ